MEHRENHQIPGNLRENPSIMGPEIRAILKKKIKGRSLQTAGQPNGNRRFHQLRSEDKDPIHQKRLFPGADKDCQEQEKC